MFLLVTLLAYPIQLAQYAFEFFSVVFGFAALPFLKIIELFVK